VTEPDTEVLSLIDESVEKELWRLDTITTIDEALKFLRNIRQLPYNVSVEEKGRLIGVVATFQEKFLTYVAGKNLGEDPFMIQLADDLFVCISGLTAASIGERYVAARQVSQIQQRSVTVNDITPLQAEILSSMPRSCQRYGNACDDEYVNYPPAAPRRANSGGGYIGDDTNTNNNNNDNMAPTSPRTPTRVTNSIDGNTVQDNQNEEETEKIVSEFTPSSRGIGSRLRHLSREAIIGMRQPTGGYDNDGGENYSCGGGTCDDTFSSHASPGCTRIARMFSAPSQNYTTPDRTYTAPF
jgi:hypothetical protein